MISDGGMTCYSVYQLPRARIRFDAALLALVLWLAVAASAAGRDQASGCRIILINATSTLSFGSQLFVPACRAELYWPVSLGCETCLGTYAGLPSVRRVVQGGAPRLVFASCDPHTISGLSSASGAPSIWLPFVSL